MAGTPTTRSPRHLMSLALDKIHDGLYELGVQLAKFDTPETSPFVFNLLDEMNQFHCKRMKSLRDYYGIPYDLRDLARLEKKGGASEAV